MINKLPNIHSPFFSLDIYNSFYLSAGLTCGVIIHLRVKYSMPGTARSPLGLLSGGNSGENKGIHPNKIRLPSRPNTLLAQGKWQREMKDSYRNFNFQFFTSFLSFPNPFFKTKK